MRKITLRSSRSPKYAELNHFTLLGSFSNDDGDPKTIPCQKLMNILPWNVATQYIFSVRLSV